MKINILVASILVLMGLQASKEEALCKDVVTCADVNHPCKCWCAFEPGPRDKKPGKDNPHFPDKALGLENKCYCADRDIEKDLKDKK